MRRILNESRWSTPAAGPPCTAGWLPVTRQLRCGAITQQPPGDRRARCSWHAQATDRRGDRRGATVAGGLTAGGRSLHPPHRPCPRPARPHHARRLVAARQIRSPAQVAADTAPPRAAADHRPRRPAHALDAGHRPRDRPLRGAAARRPRDLGRQGRRDGSDIVTRAPLGRRAREGRRGHDRRRAPGVRPPGRGPDAPRPRTGGRRARRAPARAGARRVGASPGAVDGRYDAGTEAAVASFYLRQGWDPFGATDVAARPAAHRRGRGRRRRATRTCRPSTRRAGAADRAARGRRAGPPGRGHRPRRVDTAVLARQRPRRRGSPRRGRRRERALRPRRVAVANASGTRPPADADVAAKPRARRRGGRRRPDARLNRSSTLPPDAIRARRPSADTASGPAQGVPRPGPTSIASPRAAAAVRAAGPDIAPGARRRPQAHPRRAPGQGRAAPAPSSRVDRALQAGSRSSAPGS